MVLVVYIDFLAPIYFSLDTEVSIGYGVNQLDIFPPHVFRQFFWACSGYDATLNTVVMDS